MPETKDVEAMIAELKAIQSRVRREQVVFMGMHPGDVHLPLLAAEEHLRSALYQHADTLLPLAEAGAKLPLTADGVRVVPGMTVYARLHIPSAGPLMRRVFDAGVEGIGEGDVDLYVGGRGAVLKVDPKYLYATREAADAAQIAAAEASLASAAAAKGGE